MFSFSQSHGYVRQKFKLFAKETTMKSLIVAAVALAGLLSFTTERASAQASTEAPPHSAPAKLENTDVLDMVKAGLPEEVTVAKVQGSACNFDTSPAALAAVA